MANNQSSPEISMAEPIFQNPNSYENITSIIDTLKISLQIGVKRAWSFIGCGRPPYVITSRLIDEDKSKYYWVAMSYGLGHLYMNQMKTFFSITRNIIMELLAKGVLYFKSPTAIQHFFKCSDTHKTSIFRDIFLFFYCPRNDPYLCEWMSRSAHSGRFLVLESEQHIPFSLPVSV